MPQGTISYTSIVDPKGGTYTQTLGVYPDAVSLRAVPQAGTIAKSGTVTFSYNGSSIDLPNCVTDAVRVVYSAVHGFILSVVILDRRERWKYAAPVSGEYNITRAGTQVVAKKLSLRAIIQLLLQALGEASPVVSAVDNTIYPEVRWSAVSPRDTLDQLLREWGYGLSLGFGSEPVTIVLLGSGATLSSTDAMMITSTVDPKYRPRYVRVAFGDSIAQARFKLEAVGIETNNTWEPLSTLSYKPAAGWEKESPDSLPTVKVTGPESTYNLAIKSVYRAYRITKFANNTLNIPDGSGTLSNINQVLPLFNRLLDAESIRDDGSAIPFRIYGKRRIPPNSSGQPVVNQTSTVDDEIVGEKVHFDGENGLLIFERPQYWVDGADYKPADLYLECSFNITNATTFAPNHYERDTEIDATSSGYHTVKYPEAAARTVVTYSAGQAVAGSTNNQTALNSIASLITASVGAQFSTLATQMVVYCQPILSLRCDGAIHQIQHVIDDGTTKPGSFTVASRNQEFDLFIMNRMERAHRIQTEVGILTARSTEALARRKERTDD